MDINLVDATGKVSATVPASEVVFGREFNEALVHQVVVAFQANARSGNSAQKDREAVKHSTKKPWRQKGTGRARAGMTSSPLWRGGGRIFPNLPDQNWSHKVNKKMYRAGMCSILSQLVKEDRLQVIDDFQLEAPKTKLLAAKLKGMGLESALVLADNMSENVYLASRNLKNIAFIEPKFADPVSLVHFKKVLVTKGAISKLQEMLS